jgi:hypothetical protein
MTHHRDELPDDLQAVGDRLRASRPQLDPLALDQVKQQVLARVNTDPRKGASMKARLATIATILGLVGGTSGAIALAGSTSSSGPGSNASASQYCNGKTGFPTPTHCMFSPPPPKKP